jgi:hypothetical protein
MNNNNNNNNTKINEELASPKNIDPLSITEEVYKKYIFYCEFKKIHPIEIINDRMFNILKKKIEAFLNLTNPPKTFGYLWKLLNGKENEFPICILSSKQANEVLKIIANFGVVNKNYFQAMHAIAPNILDPWNCEKNIIGIFDCYYIENTEMKSNYNLWFRKMFFHNEFTFNAFIGDKELSLELCYICLDECYFHQKILPCPSCRKIIHFTCFLELKEQCGHCRYYWSQYRH